MTTSKMKVAAIVGPTAVGKTAAALQVAETLDAEIVSVDSMQIYRGMDVGTDKANKDARERVRHHLLDLKDPSEDVSVAEFRDLARGAISEISGRGQLPLLVGGSGLYFRAIVDDLRFPPTSAAVRSRLEEERATKGTPVMYRRLTELDPEAAAKIEPNNARRIIRALEVIELTGLPFSADASWGDYDSRYALAVAGLSLERDAQFMAIESRVDRMFQQGLIAEVGSIRDIGVTAGQALAYRQILASPAAAEEELKAAIVGATKRFARRQESWFRSDPRVEWFSAAAPGVAEKLAHHFRDRLDLP